MPPASRLCSDSPGPQHDVSDVIDKRHTVNRADLHPCVADRRAGNECVASRETNVYRGTAPYCAVPVLVQLESGHLSGSRSLRLRRLECDAPGQQALQRFAAYLNTGKPAGKGNATGIPEPARTVH